MHLNNKVFLVPQEGGCYHVTKDTETRWPHLGFFKVRLMCQRVFGVSKGMMATLWCLQRVFDVSNVCLMCRTYVLCLQRMSDVSKGTLVTLLCAWSLQSVEEECRCHAQALSHTFRKISKLASHDCCVIKHMNRDISSDLN